MEAKYKVSFEITIDHGSVRYTNKEIKDAIKGGISCFRPFRLISLNTIKGVKISRGNTNKKL
jgi:hypothetical protein